MKAITLHEPWASLVAHGFKEVETRDWYTGYRGDLAIHAGKQKQDPREVSRLTFHLGHHGFELPAPHYGSIVATCRLVACLPAPLVEYKAKQLKEWFEPARGWDFERPFGTYDAGRWAWILRDVKRLDPPVSALGQRKLWEWKSNA